MKSLFHGYILRSIVIKQGNPMAGLGGMMGQGKKGKGKGRGGFRF